jgi:hypothetical protein
VKEGKFTVVAGLVKISSAKGGIAALFTKFVTRHGYMQTSNS